MSRAIPASMEPATSKVEIIEADFDNAEHAAWIVELTNSYARDPMGGGEPLPEEVKAALVDGLKKVPGAFSLLAFSGDRCVGVLNAFPGYSTFVARPLVNIHDVYVLPEFRRRGINQMLLAKTEEIARQRGCIKLTLEVLEGNTPAQAAYVKFGFGGYQLDPTTGRALFWQKKLK